MGFLDKAKEAADRAVAATTQAAQQGQAKFDTYQTGKSEAELYKTLGEAVFNEQRRGAGPAAVSEALAALDAHFAAAPAAGSATPPATGSATPPPAAGPATPTGNFTLDDL